MSARPLESVKATLRAERDGAWQRAEEYHQRYEQQKRMWEEALTIADACQKALDCLDGAPGPEGEES